MAMSPHRARDQRQQGALAVLRYAHRHPGASRAELARALGLSSGSAAEITARLKRQRLLAEVDAPPATGRGRPSPRLAAHPDGPLVWVVDIQHESWRARCVGLGGEEHDSASGRHVDATPEGVLAGLRRRLRAALRRRGDRLRAVSVSVSGTMHGTRVVQASSKGWRDVSLEPLRIGAGLPLLAGNDATLAGLAEARRGAGAGTRVVLHLTVEVGVGGILVVDGVPVGGATGAGGEFGHLPFGDPALRCPCGARGCWDLSVDGRAMARTLGRAAPRDPRTAAERVLAAAPTDPASRDAVAEAAAALGRGVGGLVNALDPGAVTLSGLAVGLLATAPRPLRHAYRAGLMRFRRAEPPPLLPSTVGADGALIGAAETGFDAVLTAEGLTAWSDRNP